MKRAISYLVKPQVLASTGRGFANYGFGKTSESLIGKRDDNKEPEAVCVKSNMCSSINDAMRIAMASDPTAIVFGEDVAFGGVFRCSVDLQDTYGTHRVFNTPICESEIVGFGIGYAAEGGTAIAEIQFADYIYPAFNQIVNEAAKYRYRSGGIMHCGGLCIRTPCGAVGHGGHYHSQSPESYFGHTAGVKVVMPRNAVTAKGLLLASIREPDPVIFMEPKILYRTSVENVPVGDYQIELGVADILEEGEDVTAVGWGSNLKVLAEGCRLARERKGTSCELIDLQTISPYDFQTIEASVKKTGRLIISHEAPRTGGFGAEIAADIAERCFFHLESPVQRVCGYDTPFPHIHEKYYIPSSEKVYDAVLRSVSS